MEEAENEKRSEDWFPHIKYMMGKNSNISMIMALEKVEATKLFDETQRKT